MSATPRFSVIIPFHDEEANLPRVIDELFEVLGDGHDFEVIAVNDGSKDGTGSALEDCAQRHPRLSVLHLARNYGQTAALSAGFDHALGDLVVPMDGDGQNDPRDIPRLLEALTPEVDLVSGWRRRRAEKSPLRRWPSAMANRLIARLTGVRLHDTGCTLKVYRREHLEDIHLYGEMHRFIPAFVHNEGGHIVEMEVNHRSREGGRSKYGLARTFKVLLDLVVVMFFTSLKDKPIYLFGGLGALWALGGVLAMSAAVWMKLVDGPWHKDLVSTPLPVIGSLMIILGVLTALVGILADITMRTYFESQGKKPYRIRRDPLHR